MNEASSRPEVTRAKAIHERMPPALTPLAKRVGAKRRSPIQDDAQADPVVELRRLVGVHKNLALDIQRLDMMIKDRTFTSDDGSKVLVKCVKSAATIADTKRCIATYKSEQAALTGAMRDALRQVPIYQAFLSQVYGVGYVLASYMVAMIRIERCENFSQLNRYCGNAPDYKTGWRENRNGAAKHDPQGQRTEGSGTFNDALRRNNFLVMQTMRKCGAKKTAERPYGTTTKYLDRWLAASHAEMTNPREARPGVDGKARRPVPDHKGRQKATDLLLWDLYVVWRALAGLDMRHDKFSVQRGRDHQGRVVDVDERFSLTVEEALEWVGNPGGVAATAPMLWKADVYAEFVKGYSEAHGGNPVEEVAWE